MGFTNIPLALGEQLLLKVKMGDSTQALEFTLEKLEISDLTGNLFTDNTKKAFWINIYNAYFQILAGKGEKAKPDIFRHKLITIAGRKFSLDDIEHGILRKYRWKPSLGCLPQLFPSAIIKSLAVSAIDFRIHFALNCGAKSCPPIAFYKVDNIDKQLDLATQSFLESETVIDDDKKTLTVTKLILWFKGDFGGEEKLKKALSKYLCKDFTNYRILYKKYNWDMELHKFAG